MWLSVEIKNMPESSYNCQTCRRVFTNVTNVLPQVLTLIIELSYNDKINNYVNFVTMNVPTKIFE